ncbi:MAG: acyltransferase family protein [Prevotella sp.]|nr:acyltransferase family protein [Prevotella sp.]
MEAIRENRNERIDSIKFWLVVLVIAGHVFSQNTFKNSFLCRVSWEWIYMFHMPLFVFISGYFSHKKSNKAFIYSILKLLEPLILFQCIFLCFIYKGEKTILVIVTPQWILWYLLSLIYWRTLLQFIPSKLLQNKKTVIIITFIIGILAGFLPFNRLLSLQRTFSFLPFFFLGYYMKGKSLSRFSKYKYLCMLFLIITLIIPYYYSKYLGDLNQADPYGSIYGMYSRIFIYGISIPMSISFIILCPNRPYFSKQGRYTMQYYIYHALIVIWLVATIQKYNLPNSFVAALLYTILITLFIWLLSYLPHFEKSTNPSEFLLKKNKSEKHTQI